MELRIHKGLALSEKQQDYLERKISRIKKLAGRHWNEENTVSVDIKENSISNSDEAVHCAIKLPLPGATLYAHADQRTIEASIDVVEDKLVHQLEKYKGKH